MPPRRAAPERDRNALAVAAILGALFAVGALDVRAQPAPESARFNTVELQADVRREVVNDTLVAVLYAELNDADTARLAGSLNRAVAETVLAAREFPAVRVRTGNSQTYPVYDRSQRLSGWRGRAELRLESRDFHSAAVLIGKMQATMQLGQIGFSVSPDSRKSAEDEMVAEAIMAFRARADVVRTALGSPGYRIRRLAVSTGGAHVSPRPMMTRAGVASDVAVLPPTLEGGVSQITVSVSGSIEVE